VYGGGEEEEGGVCENMICHHGERIKTEQGLERDDVIRDCIKLGNEETRDFSL
jgi:hypothetical protein